MNKTVRRIGIIAAVIILAAGFSISKKLGDTKKPVQLKVETETLKEAEVFYAQNRSIPTHLEVQGELVAFDKIDIFSEVNGTLKATSKPFKVGSYFPKGAVLIRVDDEETQLNLLSQKSSLLNAITQLMPDLKIDYPQSFQQWQDYLDAFDIEKAIQPFPKPLNKQEKYFIASRNIQSQYYTIKSAEERLSKYSIYAPFSGVVTQTSINSGALVRSGQKLGELMNTSNYELEATVPLSDLQYLKVGNVVQLYSDDIAGTWNGRVKRINNQLDPGTQMVKVFISINGANLKEGMYLRGRVDIGSEEGVLEIPRNLLVNENTVYTVKDSLLSLVPVEVVRINGSNVLIRGIEDGTAILKKKVPGAFEGMKVKMNAISSTETAEK